MRVLMVHNKYRNPGGEDVVFELERELLESHSHVVHPFVVSNSGLDLHSQFKKIKAGLTTFWSTDSANQLKDLIRSFRPDVIHVHNTFPRLSPSIYWAADSLNVPVVQTVHNYRMMCANGLLLRGGGVCTLCVRKQPSFYGVTNKCYRESYSASASVVGMQLIHRLIGTFRNKVTRYICLTDFQRSMLVKVGIPSDLISVKPNFMQDPCPTPPTFSLRDKRIVFVGRITNEKGLDLVLSNWRDFERDGYSLTVIGDGPEHHKLRQQYSQCNSIRWLGWLSHEGVTNEISKSRFLVMPSRLYEGFPMVVLEALATGTPIIAPAHGGFPEIIEHDNTGYLFTPGNAESLREQLAKSVSSTEEQWRELSSRCRQAYLKHYTPQKNYETLISIYNRAIGKGDIS